MTLNDWDIFVLRHQVPANVRTHLLSALLFWFSPLLALTVSPWWWLGFFLSGLLGAWGHFTFKDGGVSAREATSSWQAIYFSTVMAFYFVQGRWDDEVRRAKHRFESNQRGEIVLAGKRFT